VAEGSGEECWKICYRFICFEIQFQIFYFLIGIDIEIWNQSLKLRFQFHVK
jgi:hypothetical protein